MSLLHNEVERSLQWQIALDVANGLNAMHISNPPLAHRNIKPSNVLLDGHMRAMIADFDWVINVSEPVKGRVGTPGYSAPEVLQDEVCGACKTRCCLCLKGLQEYLWAALCRLCADDGLPCLGSSAT